MNLRRPGLRATFALVAFLGACSDDASPGTTDAATSSTGAPVDGATRDEAVAALITDVMGPAYAAADSRASELVTSLQALCAAPTDAAALVAAREAWNAARSGWAYTRAFRFGPVMELRAMSKVDFPVDPTKVAALVAGTDPLDVDSVAALGADQRGLGAIELTLFLDDTIDERECELAQSAAVLVQRMTAEVSAEWSNGLDDDSKTIIDGAVNGVIFALIEMTDQQLGKAAGDVTGTPEFAEVDDGPAHSTLTDIATVLEGVSAVVDGGLSALVATISPDAATRLAEELAATEAAVAAVPVPIADTTDTAPLSGAYEAALAPLRTLRTEFASLLGVTLTLGDADGDS